MEKGKEIIKVIFWDFDGVIMDSNSIRNIGFQEVLKEFPSDQVGMLLDFHIKNGGLSRYVKFDYFFNTLRNESLSEIEIFKWADKFSVIMRKLLLDKDLLIQQTLLFIEQNYDKYIMYIVSGSDQKELRYLCDKHSLSNYFVSINGSPTPKTELVKSILSHKRYNNQECVLIGDSINDFEAATDNGIHFLAYNNDELVRYSNIDFKL